MGACSKQAESTDYSFYAEAEQYLRIKLATSLDLYGEKLQICMNNMQHSPIERLDHEKLKEMKFTKIEINSSIFVIAVINEKRCYENEYLDAVYNLGRYTNFLERYAITQNDIDFTIKNNGNSNFRQTNPYSTKFMKQAQALFAVNSSQEYLDKEMIFESLTMEQRTYLDNIFSTKTFVQHDYIISNKLHKFQLN